MVYREHALHAPEDGDDRPDRALAVLDVSGAPGHHGAPGAHGAAGGRGGGYGGRGGAAGPAQLGQSAGVIQVSLASHPGAEGQLVLRGTTVAPSGDRREGERVVRFDRGGFLDLLARGGAGGDGGRGGDGGPGGRGSDGADATRYRSGGDGGRGGDGGDGGDGSSGAAGGAGGAIQVRVGAHDTHLLMLIRKDLRGGAGGAPGVNGRGGSGGPGGSGGSSYHWTTTSTSTNSRGETVTHTHHHSNSGGSDGSPGRRGRDANVSLYAGADGRDGDYTIQVHGGGGVATYRDRYRLRLVGFAHVSENQDGIYEPGERVHVSGLRVQNVGGMPTPPNHEVRLSLESEGWVWPDKEQHLVLPYSLAAGATAEVDGVLTFEIGGHAPEGPGDPLRAIDQILHRAALPAAHRDFADYQPEHDPHGRFHIAYPVEASPIESLYGLAPGEAARVRFAVRCVGRRSLGARGELARRLRIRVSPHESELGAADVTLLGPDDQPVPFAEGWIHELEALAGGETRALEATIAIAPGAEHYRSARIRLALELAPPSAPDVPRPIQLREFVFRVARRYQRVPGCELLLVTHHRTTREQLEAWERLATRRGLRMAIWDVSLEGHLDLTRDLGDGALADHVAGGTIAVLSDRVETAAGEVWTHDLIAPDALGALRARGVSIAVFGGAQVPLRRWLLPSPAVDAVPRESPAAFREALAALTARATDAEVREVIDVHHIGFFFEAPDEALLRARALSLDAHLRAAYPERRFVITPRFAPEAVASLGIAKRWKVGTLEVRSALGAGPTRAVHVGGTLGEARPVDLDGAYGAQVVLLAAGFERKLDRLDRALSEGRDAWPEVRAILVDLEAEQAAVRASGWGLFGESMERALPCLTALASRPLPAPPPDGPAAVPLLELAARLRLYASSQVRWWERPLGPLRRGPRLAGLTRAAVDRWLARAFAIEGDEDASEERVDAARERVRLRERAHRGGLYNRAKEERGVARDAYARLLLSEPLDWEGVTTDAELLRDEDERLHPPDELDRWRAEDAAAARLCDEVEDAQRGARERLLRRARVAPGVDSRPAEAEVGAGAEADELEVGADRSERAG